MLFSIQEELGSTMDAEEGFFALSNLFCCSRLLCVTRGGNSIPFSLSTDRCYVPLRTKRAATVAATRPINANQSSQPSPVFRLMRA